MENRRLCTQGRGITPPSRPLRYLVVGNAIGPRNNSIHQIVLFAGCASLRAPARPPSRPHAPERARGRAQPRSRHHVYKGDDTPRQSRCYIAGSNSPLCRALSATFGSGPRPSPGPRYPGRAARGTMRLITRKKPSRALFRSNASSRI